MNTYDLHGLRTAQLASKLVLIFEAERLAGSDRFRILVGKGTGALSLYLEEFLVEGSYSFTVVREGLFEIYLGEDLDFR